MKWFVNERTGSNKEGFHVPQMKRTVSSRTSGYNIEWPPLCSSWDIVYHCF